MIAVLFSYARALGAREILRFWFVEAGSENWFGGGARFDALIRERYGALHARASRDDLKGWTSDAGGALALLIVLDQFSRNLGRGSGDSFANDAAALALADRMIARGDDLALPEEARAFVYMPHMHSEELAVQERCVALFESRLPGSSNVPFAHEHRDIIARFGRFPHRNKALGRRSTPAELAYLKNGGFQPN